ncbi:MAG: MerR family transcriptional regulator [Desulfovibrio sp.]|uniref:MerR family transcriptional regulator n=1 Tax=Desulfovibrio sp. 7SRBS1 TaxID=3378064 RepID=UPI003B3EDD38
MTNDRYLIVELAQLADIPENTARRYARLFEEFFSGKRYGRATKYPRSDVQTLELISGLYRDGLTTPEIFERLHNCIDEQLHEPSPMGRPLDPTPESPDVHGELPPYDELMAAMQRQENALHDYGLVRNSVAILWKEYKRWRSQPGSVASLGNEIKKLHSQYTGLAEALEAAQQQTRDISMELALVREENAALRREQHTMQLAVKNALGPPEEFLCLPLVFLSDKNEFLGVSDRDRKHFSLLDFITLMRRNAGTTRALALRWHSTSTEWTLHISENAGQPGKVRKHYITVTRTRTPKGNMVCQLQRLSFDGHDMPPFGFYELFKHIGQEIG